MYPYERFRHPNRNRDVALAGSSLSLSRGVDGVKRERTHIPSSIQKLPCRGLPKRPYHHYHQPWCVARKEEYSAEGGRRRMSIKL